MNQIAKSGHIASYEPEDFYKSLGKLIDDYQKSGFNVEVQYQCTFHRKYGMQYSAVILGRLK